MTDLRTALAAQASTEVQFRATVCTPVHIFVGTRTHARHASFSVRPDSGPQLEIVDNIDIAPAPAVAPGDRIGVRGELVYDRSGAPIVHWTHHDPAGCHPDGWIDAGGRRYA